jgi:hypothetical protein
MPGDHNIKITIDPSNAVDEADENNNILTKASSISGADLKIISSYSIITPAGSASVGDRITINATIENTDYGTAGAHTVSFYDGNPDADGSLLVNETFTGTLEFNEKTTISINTPPITAGGTHNYYVVVDSLNSIVESNEVNNRAFVDYYVNYPPVVTNIKDVIISEDETGVSDLDLLDYISVSDNDNNETDLEFVVISISEPDCGFSLRNGRYADLSPSPNWHGSSVVNLSITDGMVITYTELSVVVESVNDPPVIENLRLDSEKIKPEDTIKLYLEVSDLDSTLLKITVSSETRLFLTQTPNLDVLFGTPLTVDAFSWDGNGNLTFSYQPVSSEAGDHRITVSVNDDFNTVTDTLDLELERPDDTAEEDLILGMEAEKAYMVLAVIIILIVIVVIVFAAASKKRKARGDELEDMTEEEEES